MPKKRRIKKAKVDFISLVPKGANLLRTMYKSADGHFELATLTKDINEQGEIYAVVYAPELRDHQGDIASAEVIKEMAYDFAKSGLGIDIRHNEKPLSKDDIFVAESTIIQKGDDRFAGITDYDGNTVDVEGGWGVVLKVENEDLRKMYREGDWQGVSMGGSMLVVEDKDEPLEKEAKSRVERAVERLRSALGMSPSRSSAYASVTISGDLDMTSEELAAVLAESNKQLLAELSKTKAPEPENKPEPKVEPVEKALTFTGDPLDEKAVREFEYKVQEAAIKKGIDTTSPESIKQGAESLRNLRKDFEDLFGEAEETEVKSKKEKPAPSNAPLSKGADDGDSEMAELVKLGKEMAAAVNKQRGF